MAGRIIRYVECIACFFSFSTLFADQNLYEIVKPGMKIKEFNKIEEIPLKIKSQKSKIYKTSYGVGREQTSAQSKYFKFKKQEEWQGGIVRYQDNKIQQFSLFNKKASTLKAGNLLRRLMGRFENSPTYHPFQSFGKKGICISWEQDGFLYNFNCTKEKKSWFYQIDVKKNTKISRSKLEISSPKVSQTLEDLGIDFENPSQSVVSKESDEEDLLELLQ